ncbi:unnamed protein product [Ectocarpus fasciculatus]
MSASSASTSSSSSSSSSPGPLKPHAFLFYTHRHYTTSACNGDQQLDFNRNQVQALIIFCPLPFIAERPASTTGLVYTTTHSLQGASILLPPSPSHAAPFLTWLPAVL